MSCRSNVVSVKYSVGQISCRSNVVSVKCRVGKMSQRLIICTYRLLYPSAELQQQEILPHLREVSHMIPGLAWVNSLNLIAQFL